jgi:hypothetical protein
MSEKQNSVAKAQLGFRPRRMRLKAISAASRTIIERRQPGNPTRPIYFDLPEC